MDHEPARAACIARPASLYIRPSHPKDVGVTRAGGRAEAGNLLWRARPDPREPSSWAADVMPGVVITFASIGLLSWRATDDIGWMALSLLMSAPAGLAAVGLLRLQEVLGFPHLEARSRGIVVRPRGLRGALARRGELLPFGAIREIATHEVEDVRVGVAVRLEGDEAWHQMDMPQWNGRDALDRLCATLAIKAPGPWALRTTSGGTQTLTRPPRGSMMPN